MTAFLSVIHALVCIFLVISILLQSSKGGGLAGMFGGGGMGNVFGGRGASTFLSKLTMWLGVAFALTSISIGLLTKGTDGPQVGVVEQMSEQQQSTPATMLPTIPGAEDAATGDQNKEN
ncbi:preprotein translocase subunit SecG [bacterium]|nr:preprotein translocase subunit SecG [bacterium]